MNKFFCNMPFNSLEVSPDGTCQTCCKIKKPILKHDSTPYNVLHDTLDDIWNSDDLNNLRKNFLTGVKPDECGLCWTEEEAGVKSLRLQTTFNNKYDTKNPKLNYISLKLSNKCNLACRICSPHLSSLWQGQWEKLNIPLMPEEMFKTISLEKFSGNRLESLHNLTQHIDHICIYGGEPLINDEILNYLKFIADADLAKNIHLTLNTNVTVYTDALVEILSKFQKINLFLSIDDVDTRFEYQRWPAKWAKIEENIKKYAELPKQFHVAFFPSISVLNILKLEEILNRLNSYNIKIVLNNIIHQPEILCIKNFPSDLKSAIKPIIENIDFSRYNFSNPESGHKEFIINFLMLPPDTKHNYQDKIHYRNDLDHFLSVHDNFRKTLIKDYLPEFYRLLHED